jgi:hypothetical protein
MNLEKLTCRNCGAPISPVSDIAECSHCGTTHVVRTPDEFVASQTPPADVDTYRPVGSAGDSQSGHKAVVGWIAGAVVLFFIAPIFLFSMILIFNTGRAVRQGSSTVPRNFSEFGSLPGGQGNVQVDVEGDLPPEVKRQLERSIRGEFGGIPRRQGDVQVNVEGDLPPEVKRQLERSIRNKLP